jgi:hypothetical protein
MVNRQRGRSLPRRSFLRAAGVSVALPFLDAMVPVGLRVAAASEELAPQRMLLIARDLGLHAPNFFPETTGKDYELTPYLKLLERHREEFTIFSGVSHLGYPGGHGTYAALFTGVAPEGLRSGTDVRNTISLDQAAAAHVGLATRFPSLTLGNASSWNHRGIKLPSETSPMKMFKQLFVSGARADVAKRLQSIHAGQSILDGVRDQAKSLASDLGQPDRDRMDLFLTSVREAEQRLKQDQEWAVKPKPQVDPKPFLTEFPNDLLKRERQWFDLVLLALQTDSTRVVSLGLESITLTNVPGVEFNHHDATHHGKDPEKLRQLALIEEAELIQFDGFLDRLKAVSQGPQSLFDRTAVFYGTNMGNANNHKCDNLPILIAGGGFKHAGHVRFDLNNNTPLSNLFVRMLQKMGIETEHFGSSTGTISEV